MGSTISRIYEDIDNYTSWCKQYNEIEGKLYSTHYYWLRDTVRGKTKLTEEEYTRQIKIEELKGRLESKYEELKELEKELKNLLKMIPGVKPKVFQIKLSEPKFNFMYTHLEVVKEPKRIYYKWYHKILNLLTFKTFFNEQYIYTVKLI